MQRLGGAYGWPDTNPRIPGRGVTFTHDTGAPYTGAPYADAP
jgi:hypothetical protein